ncbi:unnamed protein product [Closterium sp. Naga37s-1]|nr:unnamed protein product [Closterium sp. Naga37s-1]
MWNVNDGAPAEHQVCGKVVFWDRPDCSGTGVVFEIPGKWTAAKPTNYKYATTSVKIAAGVVATTRSFSCLTAMKPPGVPNFCSTASCPYNSVCSMPNNFTALCTCNYGFTMVPEGYCVGESLSAPVKESHCLLQSRRVIVCSSQGESLSAPVKEIHCLLRYGARVVEWSGSCTSIPPLSALSLPSLCLSLPLSALSLPSLCPLYALSLPSLCPLSALSLPSLCPLSALSLPSLCPLSALSLPLSALSLPSLCPLSALSLPPLCRHCNVSFNHFPNSLLLPSLPLPSLSIP